MLSIDSFGNRSPGFGITLVASSTTSALHSSEAVSSVPSTSVASTNGSDPQEMPQTPEELGSNAAFSLLANISSGSCIDQGMEWLACLMMALGSEDVGRVKLAGPLREDLILFLRDLKEVIGVTMKIRPLDEEKERELYILSCVGIGYGNIAKKT